MDSEAKASTVTPPQPASTAALLPQFVGHGGAKDGIHIDACPKVRASARRAIDALGHQGKARDMVW